MLPLDTQGLTDLAYTVAIAHKLDPALVCAICEQESSWNPWAMRFEPMFLAHYVKPPLPEAPTTTEIARATSWGLMQVMGEVALERGYPLRYLSQLCDPQNGLEYGCRELRKCIDARDTLKGALLMWNGGGNLQYADQVLARVPTYQRGT